MSQREAIENELKQMGLSLEHLSARIPYRVPDGYFEAFSDLLLERLAVNADISKNKVYQLPNGYFEGLSDRIIAAIHKADVTEEMESLSPLLNTLSKEMPFHKQASPALNMETIMQRAAVREIPVVQMRARKPLKWMRLAAAAVVAGLLITTAVLYTSDTSQQNGDMKFADYAQIDVSHEISKLSEEELNTYLSSSEKLIVAAGYREQYGEDEFPDVNEHIQYMSDDELKQYLDESGESVSSGTVESNS
nr:hypothetical protein [uncultured Sediminibacterium sp.]